MSRPNIPDFSASVASSQTGYYYEITFRFDIMGVGEDLDIHNKTQLTMIVDDFLIKFFNFGSLRKFLYYSHWVSSKTLSITPRTSMGINIETKERLKNELNDFLSQLTFVFIVCWIGNMRIGKK